MQYERIRNFSKKRRNKVTKKNVDPKKFIFSQLFIPRGLKPFHFAKIKRRGKFFWSFFYCSIQQLKISWNNF